MKYPFKYINLMWRSSRRDRRICIGRIRVIEDGKISFLYDSTGINQAKKIDPHFDGYPGLPITSSDYTDSNMLKNIFFLRLINIERTDRKYLLDFWLLDDETASDGIMLLGMTQGISLSDMFEFIPIFLRNKDTKRPFITDIAGLSVSKYDISTLKIGEKLRFEKDKDNPYDPLAIKVLHGNNFIGYIKQGHNLAFKGEKSGINLYVHNITNTPFPKLYIKVVL